MPFDPKKREVTGPSVAVMDGLLRSGPFEVNFGVSTNGTLVYPRAAARRRRPPGG